MGCLSFSVWQCCGVSSRRLRSHPDEARERHDQFFANRIDGRIRHLGKQLLEVVEQELRLIGQACQGRVRPHRTRPAPDPAKPSGSGSSAVLRAYSRTTAVFAARIRNPSGCQRGGSGRSSMDRLVFFQPHAVRLACGQILFDLLVGNDLFPLPGRRETCDPAAADPSSRISSGLIGKDSGFGCHDKQGCRA